MYTLEKLTTRIANYIFLNPTCISTISEWERRFLFDVGERCGIRPFTEKQVTRLIKILEQPEIKELILTLVPYFSTLTQLTKFLENPEFNQQPLISPNISSNQVRHVGNNWLAFRFKFNEELKRSLKSLGENGAIYNEKYTIWLIRITKNNYGNVMELIATFNLEFDSDIEQFFLNFVNDMESSPLIQIDNTSIKMNVNMDPIFESLVTKSFIDESMDLNPSAARHYCRFSKLIRRVKKDDLIDELSKIFDEDITYKNKKICDVIQYSRDFNNKVAILQNTTTNTAFISFIIENKSGLVLINPRRMSEYIGLIIQKYKDAKIYISAKEKLSKLNNPNIVNNINEADWILVPPDFVNDTIVPMELGHSINFESVFIETTYYSAWDVIPFAMPYYDEMTRAMIVYHDASLLNKFPDINRIEKPISEPNHSARIFLFNLTGSIMIERFASLKLLDLIRNENDFIRYGYIFAPYALLDAIGIYTSLIE